MLKTVWGARVAEPVVLRWLYYITEVGNLESILRLGLLSHTEVRARGLAHTDISDPMVQRWRTRAEPVHGRSIHDYVPLYVNPKNPMLYRLQAQRCALVVLAVPKAVIVPGSVVFADGNAACRNTRFSASSEVLTTAARVLRAPRWTGLPDGKRRRCAEVLVYRQLPAAAVQRVLCPDTRRARAISHRFGVVAQASEALFSW